MRRRLLTVLLLFVGAATAAGVYKWVDEHGRTVYSDRPPAGQATEKVEVPPRATPQGADGDQQDLQRPKGKAAARPAELQEVLGTFSLVFVTSRSADLPQPPFRLTAVIKSVERVFDSRFAVTDPSPAWKRDAEHVVSSHHDFALALRPGAYELRAIEVDAPSLSDSPFEYPALALRFVVPERNCVYIGRIYIVLRRLPPLPFDRAAELAKKIVEGASKESFIFHYLPRGAVIPWEFGVDMPGTAGAQQGHEGGKQALTRAREKGCLIRVAGS